MKSITYSELLVKTAEEIAEEGHKGWGNVLYDAADVVEKQSATIKELREALGLWVKYARTNESIHGMDALAKTRELLPDMVSEEEARQ